MGQATVLTHEICAASSFAHQISGPFFKMGFGNMLSSVSSYSPKASSILVLDVFLSIEGFRKVWARGRGARVRPPPWPWDTWMSPPPPDQSSGSPGCWEPPLSTDSLFHISRPHGNHSSPRLYRSPRIPGFSFGSVIVLIGLNSMDTKSCRCY